MNQEEWRPVVGLEGRYEVSSEGRIRSLDRPLVYKDGRRGTIAGRVLKGSWHANPGYVFFTVPGGHKRSVHRLVAEAFLAPPQSGFAETVNHINGNKLDNRVANLEWATHERNNSHARESGLVRQHAENCNLTKYSEQLIAAMKRVRARYNPKNSELAELFDMSPTHVGDIVRGITRKRG